MKMHGSEARVTGAAKDTAAARDLSTVTLRGVTPVRPNAVQLDRVVALANGLKVATLMASNVGILDAGQHESLAGPASHHVRAAPVGEPRVQAGAAA